MVDDLLSRAGIGFKGLNIDKKYYQQAIKNLDLWLSDEQYAEYTAQIEHLIINEHWDYLLDSFYQVIPFGTGGRRGEVGVGPNRINPVTIRNSAQGHAQYLLKQHGEEAKKRGVVLAYDVRKFLGNAFLVNDAQNPVQNLTSRDLAIAAAEVYAGNGIKTFIFDDVRTTPELSFAIRYLKTVGGNVFSASHNPPTYNGKKVYDEYGGQLVPPHDEVLVEEVTQRVSSIARTSFDEAIAKGTIIFINKEIDDAYIQAASNISLSDKRNITIAYTPLHGTGSSSVTKVLNNLGFNVLEDPKTSNPSGAFENVTFQIPNPEVIQSFDTSLQFAREQDADILLSSDPDADRMGIMVKHSNEWVFLNGNEIASILAKYVATHSKNIKDGIMVKTVVTTGAMQSICDQYGLKLIDGLLVGFKYIGDVMNKLEEEGKIENFLFGTEESHGYLAGSYARDKDAVAAAVWLSELAAELKIENKTLVDYLKKIHLENGYFKNYISEIRMLGASGNEKIHRIQETFRGNMPKKFGEYSVKDATDYQTHLPIVSETDRIAKDVLVFWIKSKDPTISSIKITIRPSGTEPKIKIYIELGYVSTDSEFELKHYIDSSDEVVKDIEKAILKTMYAAINIDFPERGFLLFWQLPLDDKLHYFSIEDNLAELKIIDDSALRKAEVDKLLAFLGSNPTQKVNDAFKAKYGQTIEEYLLLKVN